MKIERAYDKVHLTPEEIQEALKKLVREKTGREVRGAVHYDASAHHNASAYCHLEPEVRGLDIGITTALIDGVVTSLTE